MVSQSIFVTIIIVISAFISTYFGVEIFRRKSGKKFFLDIPNERSSHDQPIPRGGGIIIAAVCMTVLLIFQIYQGLEISWGYLIGALLIAAIGFVDDLRPLPFYLRLAVQISGSILLISQTGFFEVIRVPLVGNIHLWKMGLIISLGWLIWTINAYNFMDGIDGIASLQAISAGLSWFFLGYLFNSQTVQILGGLAAFSAFGFFLHNRNPAKIFMGDAGSTFLGYTFAALPFLAKREDNFIDGSLFLSGIMLLWFFLLDTIFTFLRRAWLREKVWLPHRSHIYQKIVEKQFSHSQTGLIYFISSIAVSSLFLCGLFFDEKFIDWSFISAIILTFAILLISFKAQKTRKIFPYEKRNWEG